VPKAVLSAAAKMKSGVAARSSLADVPLTGVATGLNACEEELDMEVLRSVDEAKTQL
jgi:hypothetical protein